eukprot:7520601-Heterocapsa_arctica.AAC.1
MNWDGFNISLNEDPGAILRPRPMKITFSGHADPGANLVRNFIVMGFGCNRCHRGKNRQA